MVTVDARGVASAWGVRRRDHARRPSSSVRDDDDEGGVVTATAGLSDASATGDAAAPAVVMPIVWCC